MLTDTELKHLKPKAKPYKVTDRDGMYVLVSPGGTISFRVDYRLHGRRETVTLGKYAPSDLSLARAREKCIDAKRMIAEGQSPAIEKQREKRRIKEAKSFGQFGEKWLQCAPMSSSRSPGQVDDGKPVMVSVRKCWLPSRGSSPPTSGWSVSSASRYTGVSGRRRSRRRCWRPTDFRSARSSMRPTR
jgi:Arm DNA-binding domain